MHGFRKLEDTNGIIHMCCIQIGFSYWLSIIIIVISSNAEPCKITIYRLVKRNTFARNGKAVSLWHGGTMQYNRKKSWNINGQRLKTTKYIKSNNICVKNNRHTSLLGAHKLRAQNEVEFADVMSKNINIWECTHIIRKTGFSLLLKLIIGSIFHIFYIQCSLYIVGYPSYNQMFVVFNDSRRQTQSLIDIKIRTYLTIALYFEVMRARFKPR